MEKKKQPFLDRQMDKMSDMWANAMNELEPLPEPDEFGMVKLRYQHLRKLLNQRGKISYSDGFFYGIGCAGYKK